MSDTKSRLALTPEEAAEALGIPAKTLANWRYLRVGPPYVKAGGHIRYPITRLRQWMDDHEVATSA